MIVVDASAILAIHLAEPERDMFQGKILASPGIMTPVNYWEALVRAQALDPATGRQLTEGLIVALNIIVVPIDAETSRIAVDAFAKYGKRTPAKLNLGDCFAYALAKQRGAPLLFKGDDFAHTDIVSA